MKDELRGCLCPMTAEEAREVMEWKYPAPYDMYNWEAEDDPAELLDGSYFSCREKDGRLGGFLCFGPNATIPTKESVYEAGYLDIGLGLRPDLCGKGLGRGLLELGMEWARSELGASRFRLAVAQFNLRAQKVYRSCGFREISRVTHRTLGAPFLLMVWEPSDQSRTSEKGQSL